MVHDHCGDALIDWPSDILINRVRSVSSGRGRAAILNILSNLLNQILLPDKPTFIFYCSDLGWLPQL